MEFDERSNRVIGGAVEVHREPGPGLPESTDEQCLAQELELNGIAFRLQHPQHVEYKEIRLDCGCRIGILVPRAADAGRWENRDRNRDRYRKRIMMALRHERRDACRLEIAYVAWVNGVENSGRS